MIQLYCFEIQQLSINNGIFVGQWNFMEFIVKLYSMLTDRLNGTGV